MNSNENQILKALDRISFLMTEYREKSKKKMEWYFFDEKNIKIRVEEIKIMPLHEQLKYQLEILKRNKEIVEILNSLSYIFNTVEDMFRKLEDISENTPWVKTLMTDYLNHWREMTRN